MQLDPKQHQATEYYETMRNTTDVCMCNCHLIFFPKQVMPIKVHEQIKH